MNEDVTCVDVVSNESEDGDHDQDMCDHLLRHYPVPGEIWVHLRTQCNYMSSLLAMYNCPSEGDPPYIVNGWRAMHKMSPYRVTYGTHNPAMHGLILTHSAVIPNFSWTPRLALDSETMMNLLKKYPKPDDILVLPAVTCVVSRLFFHDGNWYIANNESIEPVLPGRASGGPLGELFQTCLAQHCKRSPWKYLHDLRHDRVWFFGLYAEPPSLLHLGTCAIVPHESLLFASYDQMPNLDFNVHSCLAPCVPILPEVSLENLQPGIAQGTYDEETLMYEGSYDGLFLVNPVTMFSIRFSTPDVVFLSPLLEGKATIQDFLTARLVESHMMEISRVHMDRMSRRWWGSQVSQYIEWFFGTTYGPLVHDICWHVETMPQWISLWMAYMNSLCWDDWNQLDVDIQRLYVLLDYVCEDPNPVNWVRILKHAKYSEWVAKVVVFTMNQNRQLDLDAE